MKPLEAFRRKPLSRPVFSLVSSKHPGLGRLGHVLNGHEVPEKPAVSPLLTYGLRLPEARPDLRGRGLAKPAWRGACSHPTGVHRHVPGD